MSSDDLMSIDERGRRSKLSSSRRFGLDLLLRPDTCSSTVLALETILSF